MEPSTTKEIEVKLKQTKVCKYTIRYDIEDGESNAHVKNIYVDRAALTHCFGKYPEEVIVTVRVPNGT